MLCGLLHDLGEMYIAPEHGEADADRALDFQSYQHLVVHPHVGQLLLHPAHRLPRRGGACHRRAPRAARRLGLPALPAARRRSRRWAACWPSPKPCWACCAASGPQLARASVALRVVPGEFDLGWVGPIAYGQPQPSRRCRPAPSLDEIQVRLALLDAALQTAHVGIVALASTAQSQALMDALALAQHLLGRLRMGWNASGLWIGGDVAVQDAAEVEAVEQELLFRLRGIHRATLLRAGKLPAGDLQSLKLLGEQLGALESSEPGASGCGAGIGHYSPRTLVRPALISPRWLLPSRRRCLEP